MTTDQVVMFGLPHLVTCFLLLSAWLANRCDVNSVLVHNCSCSCSNYFILPLLLLNVLLSFQLRHNRRLEQIAIFLCSKLQDWISSPRKPRLSLRCLFPFSILWCLFKCCSWSSLGLPLQTAQSASMNSQRKYTPVSATITVPCLIFQLSGDLSEGEQVKTLPRNLKSWPSEMNLDQNLLFTASKNFPRALSR